MNKLLFLTLISLITFKGYSQQLSKLTTLNNSIKETSGLIIINNKLITHNDSGGEPALYEIDSLTGNYTRKVYVSNVTNTDWEDICTDSNYIYIADFGNNNGNRVDLKIFRILIADYLNTTNDSVTAEIINFSYSDQTNFNSSFFSTNFDAEAIISMNNSLYIFTKNWGNNRTNIYKLDNFPGTHQATKIDEINSNGLITGASFNAQNNTLMLTGYTLFASFLIKVNQFNTDQFSSGVITRYPLITNSSYQIEGIVHLSQNKYFLSSEEHSSGNSTLYLFEDSETLGQAEIKKINHTAIYPNPTSNFIYIKSSKTNTTKIYSAQGKLIKISTNKKINISDFSHGIYFLTQYDKNENQIDFQSFVVN